MYCLMNSRIVIGFSLTVSPPSVSRDGSVYHGPEYKLLSQSWRRQWLDSGRRKRKKLIVTSSRGSAGAAVWKSRWPSWAWAVRMSLTISVDVKPPWTLLRHWSQFVPNNYANRHPRTSSSASSSLTSRLSLLSSLVKAANPHWAGLHWTCYWVTGLPVANSPYCLCGRKSTLNSTRVLLRSNSSLHMNGTFSQTAWFCFSPPACGQWHGEMIENMPEK